MKVQTFYYRYQQFLEKVIIDFSCKKCLKTKRKSQKSQKSSMTSTLNAHISVNFAFQGLKFSGYMPKSLNFVTKSNFTPKLKSCGWFGENVGTERKKGSHLPIVKESVEMTDELLSFQYIFYDVVN